MVWVITGLFVLVYLLFNIAKNRNFGITHYTVTSNKLQNNFRAVLIADLHDTEYGKENEKLLTAIRTEKPNVIFLAGDIVNKDTSDFTKTFRFLEQLGNIAPTYYGYGNHEYYLELHGNFSISDDIEKLQNVFLLRYGAEDTVIAGNQIRIGGMSVDPAGYGKYGERYFEMFEKPDRFFILMSHYPWIVPEFHPDTTADVVLCGHAHGGQFHLWRDVGVFVPGKGLFPKYTSGIHNIQGTTEIVTTGLGDHTIIPRLNNQPEMVVIDFLASR